VRVIAAAAAADLATAHLGQLAGESPFVFWRDDERDLIVLYKPGGYLCHTDGSETPDLLSWARAEGLPASLALAHRLDLGTSGLVCCAATPEGIGRWGRAWAEGRVEKRYLALAEGGLRPKGVINRPLQDGRRGRPLEATTRYRALATFPPEGAARCTLLEVQIEHGRKHQIRRHLQGIGSGVVGDERYPPRKRTPLRGAPRLWLHELELRVSLAGEAPLVLRSPWPRDLVAHLESLGGAEVLGLLAGLEGGGPV
jgi:23S rRNA-/tRNA-specific pseudouridylate synthase